MLQHAKAPILSRGSGHAVAALPLLSHFQLHIASFRYVTESLSVSHNLRDKRVR